MKKTLNYTIVILLIILAAMIGVTVIRNNVDKCEHELKHYGAVAATCTENGSVEYWYCSLCGKYFADEAAENELAAITVEATGHSWNDGNVISAGSCTESGTITYTCTVCGETKTETVEATGHSYNSDGTCTVCGAVIEGMNEWTQTEVTYFTYNGKLYSDHVIYYVTSDDSCYYIENGERVYLYTADDLENGLSPVQMLSSSGSEFLVGYIVDDNGSNVLLMNIVSVS